MVYKIVCRVGRMGVGVCVCGGDELLIFQADQLLILLLNYFFFNFVMWNLVQERRKELRAVK